MVITAFSLPSGGWPRWWIRPPGLLARCLGPFIARWMRAKHRRIARTTMDTSQVPVVVIGNIVFGGTGKTGDWAKFARHRTTYPQTHWMLAGGLTPENVEEAVRASGARFVDVNSGVESAPGVKDEAKLKRFVVALHRARTT